MQTLPPEVLAPLMAFLHPNQAVLVPRLSRELYGRSSWIPRDYRFALANLRSYRESVRREHRQTELVDLIRAKRSLNFHALTVAYWAAFISMYGLEIKTIEHFEISFAPTQYDALFHRRGGRRILPAVELAKRYHGFELLSTNAALLAVFAAVAGELDLLRECLYLSGSDVVSNVFTWAAATGQMDTVEYLIGEGVTPPASSLVHAASNAHLSVCRRLLERDVPKFYASTLGVALIAACEANHVQTAAFLLSLDEIDPGHNKNAALIGSVKWGHTALVSLLLATGKCDPSDQENKAILVATSKGYEEIVELLLLDGVGSVKIDVGVHENEPLFAAVERGSWRMVRALLNTRRVDPGDKGNRCILSSCANGHVRIVEALLEYSSVNPRISNHDALIQAARKGYTLVVKLLLAWKGSNGESMDPTAQENAALIQASKHGHLDIVQLLLSIPSVNPKNNLALYEACCHGHTLVAQLLFARNAQLDVRIALRACEQAALLGHTQTVQFLLEQVRVPVSASFLLTASDAGHADTVSLLLERAEAEFHPQTLTRALALAAAKNRVQVVARLVAVKAVQFSVAPALVKAASAGFGDVLRVILFSSNGTGRRVVVPHEAVMVAKDKGVKELLKACMSKRGG
ncbi:hypothetical protein HDU77_002104 [Chytriomyces hyalinus]|nr:hypothetical protein HDU77_002104 [Chytriomyces hyalinus]